VRSVDANDFQVRIGAGEIAASCCNCSTGNLIEALTHARDLDAEHGREVLSLPNRTSTFPHQFTVYFLRSQLSADRFPERLAIIQS